MPSTAAPPAPREEKEQEKEQEMQVKHGFFRKRWSKCRADLVTTFLHKYRKCVNNIKKCLRQETEVDTRRRQSVAKLQPLPGEFLFLPFSSSISYRPIRRVASKLARKPTNELQRLRKKGDDWTANDLFRFQYGDPEAGEPEERRALAVEWLTRLTAISKKYCYLAWYEAALYACYYRLAPLLNEDEKTKHWQDVLREWGEMFLMARRIWRRPIHPQRLRVFYDLAMLCTRFGRVDHDETFALFKNSLADGDNFDFKRLNEVEFANSIDKVTRLENHVIDKYYPRRRSGGSGSGRSSMRSRRGTDPSPSRSSRGDEECASASVTRSQSSRSHQQRPHLLASQLSLADAPSLAEETPHSPSPSSPSSPRTIPTIVIEAPSRHNSIRGSPRLVRFEEQQE